MKNKRSGKRPPLFVYLGYLLVATVIFTGVTFSSYVSTASGNDKARVAKFKVESAGVQTTDITITDILPGEVRTIPLEVNNSSEVAVELTISANLQYDNLPLTMHVGSENGGGSNTWDLDPNSGEATYNLYVVWPPEKNSPEYAGQVGKINVTIDAVQKD